MIVHPLYRMCLVLRLNYSKMISSTPSFISFCCIAALSKNFLLFLVTYCKHVFLPVACKTSCSTSSCSFQLYLSPLLENFQILGLNVNLQYFFYFNGIWIYNKLFDAIQVIWLQFSSCNSPPFDIWVSSANI